MNVTRNNLKKAVAKEIISQDQADNLFEFFETIPAAGPRFDFTHVLYYMGGLIAIGAMTLFMNLGWDQFGGLGIFCISLAYATAGFSLAQYFRKNGHIVPAGICATFIVALTPLAIYGIQQAMGWWPEDTAYREYHRYIRWHWIYLEMGTLACGAIIAWVYRYPFLLMPVAVTLWYMSMDVAVMVAGDHYAAMQLRSQVSMYFGIGTILFAFIVDIRSRKSGDYAFWLYLFGVMTFWGGMTSQHSDSELAKFIYFCVNLLLIGTGVVIIRRVFVVFGAIGCSVYLGHLAAEVFENSFLFPVALTIIGILIICLGIAWQRNEKHITRKLRGILPGPLRELLDERGV